MAERIEIIVSERGAVRVRRNLEDIGAGASRAQGSVQLLSRALGLIGGAAAVTSLVRLADSFTTIQNRLRTVTDSTTQLNAATTSLFGIANRTRQPIEAIAELYQKGSIAADELGASQEDLLQFTETIGNALRVQGGSAAAASGALQQLSQSLGSGIVRAEEFNSILEGAFPVAQAAARGIDEAAGSVSRLRRLVIEGKISSEEFFNAILSQSEAVEEQLGGAVNTVGQSLTVLRNNLINVIGLFDQGTGITGLLGKAIIAVANNLETLGRVAIVVGTAMSTVLVGKGIRGTIVALNVLRTAILANPFGALAVAVVGAATAFGTLTSEIDLTEDSTLRLSDGLSGAADVLGGAVTDAVNGLGFEFEGFGEIVDTVLEDIGRGLIALVGAATGTVEALKQVFRAPLEAFGIKEGESAAEAFEKGFTDTIKGAVQTAIDRETARTTIEVEAPTERPDRPELVDTKELARQKREAEALAQALRSLRDELDPIGAAQRELAENQKTLNDAVAAGTLGREEQIRLEGELADKFRDALDPLAAVNEELSKEADLLRLSGDEREDQARLIELTNRLREQGVELSARETQALATQVTALRELNEQTQLQASILGEIRGPAEDLADRQAALTKLFEDGAITAEEFSRKLDETRLTFLGTQRDFGSGVERAFLKLQDSFGDTATQIEGVITNAFNGATDALTDFVTTGKADFSSLADSILQDVTRMAIQGLASNAFGAVSGGGGGPGAGGGLGGVIGSFFGGGGAGGAGASGGGAGFLGAASSLFGFQNGGSFDVSSATSAASIPGGTDNRLVAFRARDGERVTVDKPGDGGGGGMNITFNISTPDANSFRRSQSQILSDAQTQLARASRRNN